MAERLRSLTQVHECGVAERPCPRVECRHHLAQGENPRKFAAREDCSATCSLDVAAGGPHRHNEIGDLLGVQSTRVEQIEYRALMKIRDSGLLPREVFAGATVHRTFGWEAMADALYVLLPREKSGPKPKRQEDTHG